MSVSRRLAAIVLKGFLVILPLLVVGSLLFWVIFTLESVLGWAVRSVSREIYAPGMGIAVGIALSFAIGLVMNSSWARQALARWERLLRRIPLVKTVYGSIQDLTALLSTETRNRYNRVVLVTIGETGVKLFGFVTREDLTKITTDKPADSIAVYLPMSYQVGGYLALVPRAKVEPVDMSIEDASRLVFTAAISVGEQSPR